ncbi:MULTISPECIES: Crp/Fnr family transcriptional regulator [unclassified Marinitoga]|uniref:Crp/Fnr family transcriptional regulator n=1 Tax=unclassified Marinitoga TaxID=2640159 RepID=UPI00064103DD|nr:MULTISPECIES: Crp/Fnr family transcriptional regulator [unclassified Marinitoga]KLO22603.1 Crp/Fnr family transcription regulator [Marinitoga sp. 1155]NUU98956.1 Crp/Fnr family transcriptional regulator [Marinitoga sp. 1154]
MHPLIERFSKLIIFRKLKLSEIEELIENNILYIKEFEKNSIIKSRGEKIEEVMLLLYGRVKTEMMEIDGKIIQIEEMKAPTIMALGATFSKNSKIPVDIISEEKTLVAYITKNKIYDLCMKNKDFLIELIEYMGTKFNFISQKLWFITLNSLKDKILYYLKEKMEDKKTEVIDLEYSVEQLSHLFGVTRPALSRAFSRLEHEGIIKKEGNKIYILDKNKIENI